MQEFGAKILFLLKQGINLFDWISLVSFSKMNSIERLLKDNNCPENENGFSNYKTAKTSYY